VGIARELKREEELQVLISRAFVLSYAAFVSYLTFARWGNDSGSIMLPLGGTDSSTVGALIGFGIAGTVFFGIKQWGKNHRTPGAEVSPVRIMTSMFNVLLIASTCLLSLALFLSTGIVPRAFSDLPLMLGLTMVLLLIITANRR